jgi:hypothetical protein
MFRVLVAAAAALSLAACAGVPKDVQFDSSAKQGLIVIETEPPTGILRAQSEYALSVSSFSLEEGRFTSNPFKGWANIGGIGKAQTERGFIVGRAAPGVYAIQALTVGGHWGVCFNGGSYAFEVKPGEVTYLGVLEPRGHLVEIMTLPQLARSNEFFYVFDRPKPALKPADPAGEWKPRVRAFLDKNYPGVAAEPAAAALTPVTFNTGKDAFGLQKLCGGYYAKPAKVSGKP